MFVGARRAVRASAGAEFNLSFVKIFLELGLFFFSYFGIFILRTQGAAPGILKYGLGTYVGGGHLALERLASTMSFPIRSR
jgi:hypothetical protein